MSYQLNDINLRTVKDPKEFVEECDEEYAAKVVAAADRIIENLGTSPIVLLSGPSGSGKTTTASKISEELGRRGILTHSVGLDDYYRTIDPVTVPRTADGEMDLESPLCLDMELLNLHFTMLSEGKPIYIPRYDFVRRVRASEPSKALKLGHDEVVIFECIHALNDSITDVHPEAFKLYISTNSDVCLNGHVIFKRHWFRLLRRTVRDYNFRGTDPYETMGMWANIRSGELKYIAPFKGKANYQFDSSLPYEIAVMNSTATKLFQSIPEGIEMFDELRAVLPAIQLFGVIDSDLVPPDGLLREFIGGGIYDY